MAEHLTKKQVEDYCRQQLRAAELLSLSDHLGECEACRGRIEYAMNGDAAFFALRAEVFSEAADVPSSQSMRAHLTAEQTAGYVDRNLAGDEFQTATDHLTHCDECALAVRDLDTFKNQIASSLEREYHPATAPAEGWWHRTVEGLFAFFPKPQRLAFGAALTVLVLAVIGWLIWRTLQSEPKQEMVDLPAPAPSPAPAPQPSPSPMVVQLKDGEGQLTLNEEGTLAGAEDLPPDYQSMLKDALTGGRIERSSQLKGLSRPPSSLMSGDKQRDEFFVIEPVGKVLMTDRPTFRWSPMEGATFVVEVYDSKFDLVAASPQLTSNSWTAGSLARGKIYAWQVKATKDGQEFTSPRPPAPQARFRILDQTKANELARAKRDYPSSHLILGLLYAEAGLLKEAEEELRALQKANPDSEIARSLLKRVQALRR